MSRALAVLMALTFAAGSARAEVTDRAWYERWYHTGHDTVGKTLFSAAWPSAEYHGIAAQRLTPAPGGADLTIRIWGRSDREGWIWADVIIRFRNYAITDLQFGRRSDVFPPGTTLRSALNGLEDALLKIAPPPRATSTWAATCLRNTTPRSIHFDIAWGGRSETVQLTPGESRLYQAQGGAPEFHVTLETSVEGDDVKRTFALPTALLRDEAIACQDAFVYELSLDDAQIGIGAVAWTPGAEHPFLRHVHQTATPQRWACDPGYGWLHPLDAADLRCTP
jgi:hypothetical protein